MSIVCLRTDILQKTVFGCPCNLTAKTRQVECKFIFQVKKLSQPGIDQNLDFSSPVTKGREKCNLFNVEEQEVVVQSSEPEAQEAQNDTKRKNELYITGYEKSELCTALFKKDKNIPKLEPPSL